MKLISKKLILFMLLLNATIGYAQVQCILKQPSFNKLSEEDLFDVILTSSATGNTKVYLLGTVKSESEIYNSRSEVFTIKPGTNNISQLRITHSEFVNSTAKNTVLRTGNFPTGNYSLCIHVLRKDDDTEIGTTCIIHPVTNEIEKANAAVAAASPSKKHVRFYGYGSVEYFNATRKGTEQVVPEEYTRADLHPSFSLYDVPLTANVFYSTEQSPLRQDIITYNLAFDAATFRNNLKTQVVQRLKSISKSQGQSKALSVTKIKDLEGLQKQLENKDYTGLEEKIKTMPDENSLNTSLDALTKTKDSLEQNSGNNQQSVLKLIEKKKQINDLQEEYRQLQELKAKKVKYESLLAKKNELESLKKQYGTAEKIREIKNFDYNSLNDPTVLKTQLKQFGLFSGMNRLLYGVKELKIGTCFPFYSPLVLDGVQVQGGSAEINFGGLYIAATGGQTQNALLTPDTTAHAYKQNMIAVKAGFGRPYGTHFFLTGLRAVDDAKSIPNDSALGLKPRSNYVIGSELQIALFKNHFIIKGEAGLSEHIRNQYDALIPFDSTNVPFEIPLEIRPNYSTSFDFAYIGGAEIHMFNNNTILKGNYRKIGPGYVTFGSPFLRNDVERIEVSAEQKLLSGQFSVAGFYKTDHDNQLNVKGTTTTFMNFGGSVRMHFKRLPYLDISYMPTLQDNKLYTYRVHIATATAGYFFHLKQINFNTSASYNFSENETAETVNKFRSDYLMVNQSISLPWPLTISASGSYITNETDTITTKTLGTDIFISFTLFKRVNPSIGFTYYSDNDNKTNIGGYAEISVRLLKYFTWNIRGEFNDYNADLAFYNNLNYINAFEEYQLRTSLIVNW